MISPLPQANTATWEAGEQFWLPLYSSSAKSALVHLSLSTTGQLDLDLEVIWGNVGTARIDAVKPPMVWTVAGSCQVRGRPRQAPQSQVTAVLTWREAASPASYPPRTWHDAAAGAVDLPPTAGWVTSVAAATIITIGPTVIALPIGVRIPIVAPAELTAGVVVAEHLV